MKLFSKTEPAENKTFEEILSRRIERRSFLKGALSAAPLLVAGTSLIDSTDASAQELPLDDDELALGTTENRAATLADKLEFLPIRLNTEDRITVANGYAASVLLKWGDPLTSNAPAFSLIRQTPAAQAEQFGFNCDYVGYFPLPNFAAKSSTTGLLVVNHEYTDPLNMFLGYQAGNPTKDQVDIELAAHGASVVEIERTATGWRYKVGSAFNRRLTGQTEMILTGPAAGNELLKTSEDPTGTRVRGMLNNCAAGKTPWGTVLTCEENFNQYFANNSKLADADPRKRIHSRYGLTSAASERAWEKFYQRFDIEKEPNEPFRFGWVVEFDPYDPTFVPRKRTALGRMKHEAATTVVAKDGRVVIYTGDDERFDYMYKFVTKNKVNLQNRAANFNLLDEGTLYVAKFSDNGTGTWIPLIGGQGPLAGWTQAEVCINTRGAADLVGATKMDRPEDIEVNPVSGKVYCVMTNNTRRATDNNPATDAANPRPANKHGHIIELTEAGDDQAATSFEWEIFMLCGDPQVAADGVYYAGFSLAGMSPISTPDNITFDKRGNLWISTDGMPSTLKVHDTVYAVPTAGPNRGKLKPFLSAPVAAEICGPEMTPANDTFFCAIQHPGEGGSVEKPTSTWPDGTTPARPSVIAVVKTSDGSKTIGR